MAAGTEKQSSAKHQLLVFGPVHVVERNWSDFSQRFHILEPYKSSLPLEQYLLAHAQSIRAFLCVSPTVAVTSSLLDLLPSLRLIVTSSRGLNNIDLPECRRRGISIANASTLYSADVADLAVGLLIDVLRRISAADGFVRSGHWPGQLVYPLGAKLGSKRVGIVGLGSIGLEIAKRLEAFGCIISYFSRTKKSAVSYSFYANLSELASDSDILIICCPLTDQTHHLIDRPVLLALGKKGVVVNIARGAVIDEKDLVECLQKGEIGGAGLDCFETEPKVSEELRELGNVVLSPHVAVYTEEGLGDAYELVCGNLQAFFSNQPLLSPITEEENE